MAKLLNFQGTSPLLQVGSLSYYDYHDNPLALKLLREKGVAIEQVTLDHKYVQSLAERLEKTDNEK